MLLGEASDYLMSFLPEVGCQFSLYTHAQNPCGVVIYDIIIQCTCGGESGDSW
ncbi:hypothetical protein DGWBC_1590 [Dehalogenimonas sp. WBC-2]|nr:hypothetical protein DGWBC_1590 [Dehalogenimonas sp. WBC-2]